MRNIVCIGHAKCGTTLLDEAFRSTGVAATPVEEKEIKFFLPKNFPAEGSGRSYLDCFGVDGGSVGYTFEASPPYAHQEPEVLVQVLLNIKKAAQDPLVVICFRHPVLRAHSHYIHNLHSFALYGAGVYNRRPDLPRKRCANGLEEELSQTNRLRSSYSNCLLAARQILGRENVALFFLEQDAERLDEWARRELGMPDDLARALESQNGRPPVFARRPVPNYHVENGTLVAFGSLPGECVRYEGLPDSKIEEILGWRGRWTTSLTAEDSRRLMERHFREDVEACIRLTGDSRFASYLEEEVTSSQVEFANVSLLGTMHGEDPGCRGRQE